MPKMEEYKPSTQATPAERLLVDALYEQRDQECITPWENTFLSSVKTRLDEDFVLMLSSKQRAILVRIWDKLYDQGLVV